MKSLLTGKPLQQALLIMVLAAVPATLVLGPDNFLLMLARSFMRQWVVVFALLAVFFLWHRRISHVVLTGMAAVLISLEVPWQEPTVAVPDVQGHLLRVGQFNVLQPNKNRVQVIAAARASGADVLSFQEVDGAWAAALRETLSQEFPYHLVVPRNDCYGIALYSRLPLEGMELLDLFGAPAIRANVHAPGGVVSVTAVHARSPFPYAAFGKRNRQFEFLAAALRNQALPQVVIGDLNAVSWDDALMTFRERAGLESAPAYEQATFPSVLGSAMIPIDHILGSPELTIGNATTLLLEGSDHRGLIADVGKHSP